MTTYEIVIARMFHICFWLRCSYFWQLSAGFPGHMYSYFNALCICSYAFRIFRIRLNYQKHDNLFESGGQEFYTPPAAIYNKFPFALLFRIICTASYYHRMFVLFAYFRCAVFSHFVHISTNYLKASSEVGAAGRQPRNCFVCACARALWF